MAAANQAGPRWSSARLYVFDLLEVGTKGSPAKPGGLVVGGARAKHCDPVTVDVPQSRRLFRLAAHR
jgi:hypothetical protein